MSFTSINSILSPAVDLATNHRPLSPYVSDYLGPTPQKGGSSAPQGPPLEASDPASQLSQAYSSDDRASTITPPKLFSAGPDAQAEQPAASIPSGNARGSVSRAARCPSHSAAVLVSPDMYTPEELNAAWTLFSWRGLKSAQALLNARRAMATLQNAIRPVPTAPDNYDADDEGLCEECCKECCDACSDQQNEAAHSDDALVISSWSSPRVRTHFDYLPPLDIDTADEQHVLPNRKGKQSAPPTKLSSTKVMAPEEEVRVTSSGRLVKAPKRFKG